MRKNMFIYAYNNQDITYDVCYSPKTKQVQTILFLGTVQVGKLVEMTALVCPPGNAVVEGAKHWFASDDGHDIPEFMLGYTKHALLSVLGAKKLESVNIVAESQAASCILAILCDAKLACDIHKIVLIQPLGLNNQAFGENDVQRLRTFKKRILANMKHQIKSLIVDKNLRFSYLQLFKYAYFKDDISQAQYVAGLAHDNLPDLRKIWQHYNVTILCGENDKIFPFDEIVRNLEDAHIGSPIEIIPGASHSPLVTNLGQKFLKRAFAIIKDEGD